MGVLGEPVCVLWPKPMCRKHVDGLSPALKNFLLPPSPLYSALVSRSQQKAIGDHQDKVTSPPVISHRPSCLPSILTHIQPTDPKAWQTGLKRGSIRKKLRRGKASWLHFPPSAPTHLSLYSLLVFPSLFPRIARMICS